MLDARQTSPYPIPVVNTPAALAVTRLTLTRFRGYDSARLEPDHRPVVLTGPNGAGKTNLLEAVSFLAPGRGLRGAKLAEVERIGGSAGNGAGVGWAVAAVLDTPTGPVEIGTGRELSSQAASGAERDRRVVRVDGHPAKGQTVLAEHVAVVWLTPQMDRLFLEGSSGRRRFLDRLVFGFDPAHAGRLSRYEHALRERARLLREGHRGWNGDEGWLSGLEDQMATTGVAVAAARRDVVQRLRAACGRAVGPFPGADLTVQGTVERWLDDGPALAAEDALRRSLRDSRRADSDSGGATLGPHKSDLAVRHAQKDMPAALCSTGEQKALLIAIMLANARLLAAERGAAPLLLLDEVAAHLDPQRREALFDEILALGAQAWMTGTDDSVFGPLGGAAKRFHIEDATVTPA
ncbi:MULTISPECIES: DNA replication/repair protein RecF [Azospirillum]|uniref:DNA replication and repair protein RecF n=2 Tax=Azospirillum brasilense TaxID=192 RepID=A0ABU4P2D0_AZOBR|nr:MULTISPECIES: DNA replication/repair protein RecF [Azospirillum]MDW7555967.1 DNA replication/repair protein RecF [Azospirillum brasilense]MDW7595339.1 DNA replication/repair protein RecF [Azospirillum brasilense]MDW7630184.1 DNA replication/repair protein RecF [Azospirillum brasilense]MDX5951695.1 DNA replication/repair protein RecF [Azospirillum brasilense]TVZ53798.1 DNA replication and repair protein RecF [Azospirillum brasilense]